MTFITLLLVLAIGLAVYLVKQYNEAQAKAQTIEEAQSNITVAIKSVLI